VEKRLVLLGLLQRVRQLHPADPIPACRISIQSTYVPPGLTLVHTCKLTESEFGIRNSGFSGPVVDCGSAKYPLQRSKGIGTVLGLVGSENDTPGRKRDFFVFLRTRFLREPVEAKWNCI